MGNIVEVMEDLVNNKTWGTSRGWLPLKCSGFFTKRTERITVISMYKLISTR